MGVLILIMLLPVFFLCLAMPIAFVDRLTNFRSGGGKISVKLVLQMLCIALISSPIAIFFPYIILSNESIYAFYLIFSLLAIGLIILFSLLLLSICLTKVNHRYNTFELGIWLTLAIYPSLLLFIYFCFPNVVNYFDIKLVY